MPRSAVRGEKEDDKRVIRQDGVHTLAIGHYRN